MAPTAALRRAGAKACTRYLKSATITKTGLAAGRRTFTISGRGRVPGAYRVTLTVRNAAAAVSLPVRSTLTIAPR